MEIDEDKEEFGEEGDTSYIPPEERKMLMIKRVLHATEVPLEASQREKTFRYKCKVAIKT